MVKSNANCVVALAVCGAFTQFLISENNFEFFPRDRVINIFVSLAVFTVISYILSEIQFDNNAVKLLILGYFIWRIFITTVIFANFFTVFYGANALGIYILTATVFVLAYRPQQGKICGIYMFFVVINIIMVLMITLLSADKINTMNIYANDVGFKFSLKKMTIWPELLPVAFIIPKGKLRLKSQQKYLYITAAFFVFITLLQGLCVRGNMLYSLTPLQSLMQIFSSDTVKRFDYLLAVFYSINFMGGIMLYTIAIKCIFSKENVSEGS